MNLGWFIPLALIVQALGWRNKKLPMPWRYALVLVGGLLGLATAWHRGDLLFIGAQVVLAPLLYAMMRSEQASPAVSVSRGVLCRPVHFSGVAALRGFALEYGKNLLRGISLFLLLAIAVVVFRQVDMEGNAATELLEVYVLHAGWQGIALFVLCCALAMCVGIPRQLLSFAGGYAFGFMAGAFWATLGCVLGCGLSFFYSRFVGQSFFQKRLGKRTEKFEHFLGQHPFSMTVLLRFLPAGNNLLTCVLAGLTKVKPLPFIVGSAVGYLPQNIIFSLLGSGIEVESSTRTIVSALLLLLCLLIGWSLARKYKSKAAFSAKDSA